MIIKQVKQYKNSRPRIEINKKDNIPPGTDVAISLLQEYQDTKTEISNLKKSLDTLQKENSLLQQRCKDYEKQEVNLKKIVEDVTSPIHSHYKNELEKKDNELKALQDKFNALEHECINYNLELNGFNGFELIVMRKHKKMVKQFTGRVNTITGKNRLQDAEDNTALTENKTNIQ